MAGNYITNNEPYVLRPSAGDIRSTSKLIGGTVAWNQLFKEVSSSNWIYTDASLGSTTFSGGECAYTTLSESTSYRNGILSRQGTFGIVGHKYIVYAEAKASRDGITIGGDICNIGFTFTGSLTSSYQAFAKVINCTAAQNAFLCLRGGHQINDVVTFKNLMLIDLTQMFGSTIADYIYSLETATAGAGVAFFRSLFPNDYYPYDAGSLKSVEGVSAHETTGFNQWDESKDNIGKNIGADGSLVNNNAYATSDYIPVFPNTTYYAKNVGPSANVRTSFFYDSEKNPISSFSIGGSSGIPVSGNIPTPANARYIRIVRFVSETEFCFNLSWSGYRNGEYESYAKHSYPLDTTLTLRGIPKLDSSNHLYYDGDTYESDGTVTRRYGIVDLGTLTWAKTTGSSSKLVRMYSTSMSSIAKKASSNNDVANCICPLFITASANGGYSGMVRNCVTIDRDATVSIYPTATYADATAFKTAMSGVYLVYELATPTTETARSFAASHVVNKYGTEGFVYDDDVLPIPVGHETTYLSKEDKSEKGEYLNAAGLSYFWEKVKSFFAKKIGFPEAPYQEVEWVESNGKQFVYLDWKPPIATWGFDADFLIKNACNTTQSAAWNPSTNVNGWGTVFGTRNAAGVNDLEMGSYTNVGHLRVGTTTNIFTSGAMKTDKSRQRISLIGSTLTKANGTTATVTRPSETANKPYCNMCLFCVHEGLRRASYGNLVYPGSVRIYNLKFYEGMTVVVNLVGAIRKSDGVTGLYDKVAGHFYPAPGMTYGNDVGDLGSTETVLETAKNTIVQGTANNITHRRMWTVNVPTLSKLVDGQKLSITPMYTVVASVESDLASTEDSGNNTYVYLKLTLAGGNTTDWIPCYYMGATRLTSHYGSGHPILFTYHENVFYGATDTASGSTIMCGMFADPNYNTDRTYDVYSDTVIAGANGIKRYTLCMQDSTGKWTSIVNEANNANATGKTCYTGGLRLGKVLYHSAGAEYASGANSGTMWQTYAFDARYSMNGIANAASTTLQMRKPFYLVGTLHSDGLFYLDTTKWWVQDEPTTEDGKVYLLVGWAYSSYHAVYLAAHNPAYVFKNGKLQELTNTHVVDVDVPANAKFTDTVTTATTSGSGNAVTAITASNGALTVTKGTTFLTSHQDISGKVNKSGDTMTGDLKRTINSGAIVTKEETSFYQSPVPKYIWHDVLAFCRIKTPTYYTSANGTSWTEATLNKNLFAQKEAWGSQTILSSTIKGSRWTWINAGLYASNVSWLIIGITYTLTISHFDVSLETSSDSGSTWTSLCSVQNVYYSQQPIWIKLSGTCQDSIRLTITNNSQSASGASLPICSLKLLTPRWGNQGQGSEYERPVSWDDNYNISPLTGAKFVGNLTGDVTGTASKATADASGNTITSTYLTKAAGVTGVTWDSTNKKLTKTINGSTTDVVTAATLRTGLNVADGAEVNQNAFSNVKVGSTTVAADAKTDTLELVAGSNVTLTPDATNDKVTIAATDTTYGVATGSKDGLMSSSDFTKLSGIATGAEVNQNAFSNVKVGSTTVAADAKTDTLELAAGTNITLTPDATNDKVTIAATDTTYSAGTGLSLSGTTFSNAIKTRNDLMSLASKTYTGVIGSTNDDAGTYLYCMKVMPTSYYASWEITYRVTATITGVSEANGSGYETSIVHICGMRDTYSAYSTWNEVSNTSYRPYCYHCFYLAKSAGITGGYGHLLGISLRYAYSPVTAANARTVSFDILETKDCAVTFFDAPTKYASCPGTGTTNYSTQTAFDGLTQGITIAGDRNDVNYYNRTNYSSRTTTAALYRYQLCLTKPNGALVPVNSVNNSVATNKTLTTDTFDPFGEIFFWQSTSTYSANTTVGNGAFYRQYLCDFRYSFNIGGYDVAGTLTARNPLYLVASLQSDGLAKLHSAPLSQTLPSSDDGLIYIYLGRVYEDTIPYRCVMTFNHPIYWYKDGAVRLYNGTNYVAGDNISLDRNSSDGSVTINAVITEQLSVSTTSDKQVKIKNNSTTAEHYAIASSQKGAANGVASLGSDGKVPGTQLPDNSNLSAVEARVTALEGLLNVVESWSPSSGYSIASSSSWSAALGSKAFQLAKGTYIVMFGADFSSNASGYRMVQINTSAAGNRYTPTSPPANGNNTRLMGTVLLEPTATTNYYMYVFQNSGATLTVTPWARIIKIG